METLGATTASASRRHRSRKLRWEYTGVLTKQPSKTALKRSAGPTKPHAPVALDPPLAESFLSDASMATSHSQTTAASSNDPQTPTTPLGVITATPLNAIPSPAAASSSARLSVDSDALARMGRVAKKRVESLAQRDALVGRWRKRRLDAAERLVASGGASSAMPSPVSVAATPLSGARRRRRADSARVECQVLDFKSRRRDEYKILARMNIAGSLRELMGVLATDNAAHFHRSMAALFGAQYLTGENVATSESVGPRRTRSTSARLSKALLLASRRPSAGLGASRATSSSASASLWSSSPRGSVGFSNIKVALNSVTLQLRHGLFRRQLHDWQFLDYLDEKVDAMAVTRVLQTVPSKYKKSSRAFSASSQQQRRSVGDVLAGYVIREDREAQFTRVFFYGEARSAGKVASHTKKLLREMVETLCRLVATVERQRLSALYELHRQSESVPVAASRCFACNASFGLSSRRHTCACCRQSVCRKCLEEREIEPRGDADAATKALAIGPPVVQRVRVCRGCVDRVSLPSLAATRRSGGHERLSERDEKEEEEEDDDVVVVDASSDSGSYDW